MSSQIALDSEFFLGDGLHNESNISSVVEGGAARLLAHLSLLPKLIGRYFAETGNESRDPESYAISHHIKFLNPGTAIDYFTLVSNPHRVGEPVFQTSLTGYVPVRLELGSTGKLYFKVDDHSQAA